jgi:hypothetical protein
MSHSVGWLEYRQIFVLLASFFILGKRKKSQGVRSGEYGGWDNRGIFFGLKTLEWKGRCEQELCRGEETNHFEKADDSTF